MWHCSILFIFVFLLLINLLKPQTLLLGCAKGDYTHLRIHSIYTALVHSQLCVITRILTTCVCVCVTMTESDVLFVHALHSKIPC